MSCTFRAFLFLTTAALPSVLGAQEAPKIEAFVGYSHFRLEAGFPGSAGHGGSAGATYHLSNRLGVSGDWTGHWFNRVRFESFVAPPEVGRTVSEAETTTHHFLVGPQLTVLRSDRFALGLRAAIGARRMHNSGSFTTPEAERPELRERMEFSSSTWRAASSFGGSLDTTLTRRLAWRVQPEVIFWRERGNQTDFRVSTGLVFRFGRR